MVFRNNIPQPADNLDDSQVDLLGNMQQLDTSFGIDHYPFSDLTVNNGFHNKVTTPIIVGGVDPVTTTNPIFYAKDSTVNLGVLQYSRGPNNAVSTPLTKLQSPAAGIVILNNATTLVLDFAGLPGIIAKLYGYDVSGKFGENFIGWNSVSLNVVSLLTPVAGGLGGIASGTQLLLKNASGGTLNAVVWTLEFMRIS